MASQKRVGVGLVGLGMVASAHARSLLDLANLIDVRGVFCRDKARREAFSAKYGFPSSSSLDDLLGDPALDLIILITPPDARVNIVKQCAAAGKHVLMEKPLERTSAAAHEIISVCKLAGIRLGVVFQERLREETRALMGLADSGELGNIVAGQFFVPWWRPQGYYSTLGRGTYARDGGGVLITQAIHTLDIMLKVMGPPKNVQAVAGTTRLHKMEGEDTVSAGIRFANGSFGTLWATTGSFPGSPESVTIDFERGSARLVAGMLEISHHDGSIRTIGTTNARTGGGADPMDFPHNWHRDVIFDFVSAIRDNRSPSILGTDAFQVHLLIDALLLSSREGRMVTVAEIAAPFKGGNDT